MARMKQEDDDLFFRAYLTETTRACANNVAHAFGGQTIGKSFLDIVQKPQVKEETRTSAQIISDISAKLEKAGKDGRI